MQVPALSLENVSGRRQVKDQALVVRRVDNPTQRINRYPADSVVCFVNTYPESQKLPVNRSFYLFLSKRFIT